MTEDDPLAFMRGEVVPEAQSRGSTEVSVGIAVTLETDANGKPTKASEEVIGKALELNGELGTRVTGWIIGDKAEERSKSFVHYGLDKILISEAEKGISTQTISSLLAHWAEREKPELWIFPHTINSVALAARVAARLKTGLVTCVESMQIDLNDRTIEMTHLEIQGKMRRTIVMRQARPQMVTVVQGFGPPARLDETRRTPIENYKV